MGEDTIGGTVVDAVVAAAGIFFSLSDASMGCIFICVFIDTAVLERLLLF